MNQPSFRDENPYESPVKAEFSNPKRNSFTRDEILWQCLIGLMALSLTFSITAILWMLGVLG
jgi:hypothetical protein